MDLIKENPYAILGVTPKANLEEIKSAYRNLVKRHHPDTGGDSEIVVKLNAAWEILSDPEKRKLYEKQNINNESKERGIRNAQASAAAKATHKITTKNEGELIQWMSNVFVPIDKLLGQIINPFPKQLRSLSADPYDDNLMEIFCSYLEHSQKKLKKINLIYSKNPLPLFAKELGLNLYHCLSQVEDALNELERYTMGYVDSYLNDGREMLREAKQKRIQLNNERRRLNIS